MAARPESIDDTIAALEGQGYVCGRPLGTVAFLALALGKPLFLEGEAGVGKTEIAKALAAALGRRLIRLQCYEGLDASSAIYEWNFAAQMIAIRTAEATGAADREMLQQELFSGDFLIKRPLLEAMEPHAEGPPVLLIDEVDRTDEPFEAFLLEALSDFQVTIPELGTIKAQEPPIVILTSNRTREVHDALKRRCLYHWVDFPSFDREMAILQARVPEAPRSCRPRSWPSSRRSGRRISSRPRAWPKSIDWARCLIALDTLALSPEVISDTLGAVLKYQDDIAKIAGSRGHAHPERGPRDPRAAGLMDAAPPLPETEGRLVGEHRPFRPRAPQGGRPRRSRAGAGGGGGRGGGWLHPQDRLLPHAPRDAHPPGRAPRGLRPDLRDVLARPRLHRADDPPLLAHAPPGGGGAKEEGRATPRLRGAERRGRSRLRRCRKREELQLDARVSWSAAERLRAMDFEQMSAAEIREAAQAVRTLSLPVKPVPTRRSIASQSGRRPDLRATLRRSLRRGGEIERIEMRKRRTRPPDLVALCDISGSMTVYSRMLMHFLHAVTWAPERGWGRVSVFTFGTRLTNVTRALAQKDPDAALAAAGRDAQDWEGGTRIGEALRRFNVDWSRRVLGQGAVVLLITDGLERGDTTDAGARDRAAAGSPAGSSSG